MDEIWKYYLCINSEKKNLAINTDVSIHNAMKAISVGILLLGVIISSKALQKLEVIMGGHPKSNMVFSIFRKTNTLVGLQITVYGFGIMRFWWVLLRLTIKQPVVCTLTIRNRLVINMLEVPTEETWKIEDAYELGQTAWEMITTFRLIWR